MSNYPWHLLAFQFRAFNSQVFDLPRDAEKNSRSFLGNAKYMHELQYMHITKFGAYYQNVHNSVILSSIHKIMAYFSDVINTVKCITSSVKHIFNYSWKPIDLKIYSKTCCPFTIRLYNSR